MALEAKVNHHNGGEQHDGEDNEHQEQVDEKDQGVHGDDQQGPCQAAPGAPWLPGQELVIHVIRREGGKHPRLLREVFCPQVLSIVAGHSSRRLLINPSSYPKWFLCFWQQTCNLQGLFLPLPHMEENTDPEIVTQQGRKSLLRPPPLPGPGQHRLFPLRMFFSTVPTSVWK